MKSSLQFTLQVSGTQARSLRALQSLFAAGCNFLAPVVRDTRCWNRVALHHLTYKSLRERFPQLGSQMVCNVIYSVCRSARVVYQHPNSPWNVIKNPTATLPLLQFRPMAPVYFDRHTLSLKDKGLSLFTLDGRMHFQLDLSPEVVGRFQTERLREIALMSQGDTFVLHFRLDDLTEPAEKGTPAWGDLPEYLIVQSSQIIDPSPIQQPAPASLIA
jgi:hypothetical protein